MKEIIQNLVRYNTWANTRYSRWIKSLPIEVLDKEVSSSYNTLTKTLGHIIDAQQFWILFLKDAIYTSYQWNNCKTYSPTLFTSFMESTIQFEECCNSFTELDLQVKRKFETTWANNELALGNYIIHTINHNSYHRGQIVTMAHQLEHTDNIPHTEYSFYLRDIVLQK
ncbi:MAG TPA: DinB family protein [Chitinophagales bacterium]|nr:DinB family protein [Chitinophagales bacterium]HMZ95095.1 DinB family protein [Chitinophagales bacterium]HNC65145.1 DinB family protein [Chitinophagales bacterium]HND46223.1 DinB family protein [Chitinophagales bacterium]HNE87618.1 DinB family protein [Chitinophagales bacterium]